MGLIGLIDPPRKEVKDSVRICHEAGIRVSSQMNETKSRSLIAIRFA